MAFTVLVNNMQYGVDVEPETPLLWVLREHLGLTGTKYGCGVAQCGSCTVMIDGKVQFSIKGALRRRTVTIGPPVPPGIDGW